MSRYKIETTDIGVQGDRPIWSLYGLETYGDTREELLANAAITETDQDGGEFDVTPLEGHGDDVYRAVEAIIDREMARQDRIYDSANVLLDSLFEFVMCVKRGDFVIRPDQDPSRMKGAHARLCKHAMEKAEKLIDKIEGTPGALGTNRR